MQIIFIGLPGAGKGTQAQRIVGKFGIPHISTGDIFRAAMAEGTYLGRKAKEYVDQGLLVPDDVTVGIVQERLRHPDADRGFLLDGFPRTVSQAESLKKVLQEMNKRVDVAIHLDVKYESLLERLTGRRICRTCGDTYHVLLKRPTTEGKCDSCGGDLIQRADDTKETVATRLDVNIRQQEPLLQYYKGQGVLHAINGEADVEEVFEQVSEVLESCTERG